MSVDFFSIAYLEALVHAYLVPFAIDLMVAALVFVVGRWLAKLLVRIARGFMSRTKVDESLEKFLADVMYALLLVVVAIAALDQLGVETTAAIAVLGAAGLAIGLALQGSLGNFASGVMLIGFRPYKIGDFVRVAGEFGTVETIRIFNTELITPDNRRIIVPNGQITSNVIENITSEQTRRVDLTFGIGYDDDIDLARQIMTEIVTSHPKVLADPEPVIAVSQLADSSVNFICRPWCKTEDYWAVNRELTEQIKKAFDAGGITIPYPQRDVHMHQVTAA